jgi:hypothetical protein
MVGTSATLPRKAARLRRKALKLRQIAIARGKAQISSKRRVNGAYPLAGKAPSGQCD